MGNKIRLGIIYGGKTSEHEVSLLTALSIMKAVDKNKYEVQPIYVQMDGTWLKGGPIADQVLESVNVLRLDGGVSSGSNDHDQEKQGQITHAGNQSLMGKPANVMSIHQEVDVIFPVIHGPNGEDGTVQGLLELAGIPYVGTGVMASAVGMDKLMMKNVFAQAGLDQVQYMGFLRSQIERDVDNVMNQIEQKLGYPCFVKPANMGSSVGITKAKDRDDLRGALELACKFDRRIIVEEFIKAREVEIGVLGNEELRTSVIGEVIAAKEFYDYEAKYKGGGTDLKIPADLPQQVADRIAEMAKTAFQALDGSGLSRVDFFYDEENDRVVINEVNTMPGFTPFSMYPMLFAEAGIPYAELIDQLVQLGLERYEEKQRNIVAAEELE
ncbi:D-alanine--D-alanine ligase [Brevibacillus laterosporus]|uniref:D-alanine--D-alanine ligase n=1 Tax=Brevibacillus laterosporus TaxID=1465 RepID=UPI000EAB566D|nr:D-alanine--D-alanine ligase [Brevibacillus laterosporus]AYK07272.1 D-alanine--D-alanine ligase [Brevibacillus laterosporus]